MEAEGRAAAALACECLPFEVTSHVKVTRLVKFDMQASFNNSAYGFLNSQRREIFYCILGGQLG